MRFDFDAAKDATNREKHGISLALASQFDFRTAVNWVDSRKDYGEVREIAIGYIGNRLHALVFTKRADVVRVISLRKANNLERKTYHVSQKEHGPG